MTDTVYMYPLDLTGAAATNLVSGEKQTLNPPTEPLDYNFFIPFAGPYYKNTLQLNLLSTGRTLVPGVDWQPCFKFYSASYETEYVQGGLYLGVLLMDNTLSGQVLLSYQNLGDVWTLDEHKILEILSARLVDPRTASYESVSGKPSVFPPIDHGINAEDVTGWQEVISAQMDIAAAIRERTIWLQTHPPVINVEGMSEDAVRALIDEMLSQLEALIQELTDALNALTIRVGNLETLVNDLISRVTSLEARVTELEKLVPRVDALEDRADLTDRRFLLTSRRLLDLTDNAKRYFLSQG